MTACVLAALTLFPLFKALTHAANPDYARAIRETPVTVVANPEECSFKFDPIGKNTFDKSSCDIAKAYLARNGINYRNAPAPAGAAAEVRIGQRAVVAPDSSVTGEAALAADITAFQSAVGDALIEAGYPQEADPDDINRPLVIAIIAVSYTHLTLPTKA